MFFVAVLGGGPGSEPWSRELCGLTAGLEGGHVLSLRAEPARCQAVVLLPQALHPTTWKPPLQPG